MGLTAILFLATLGLAGVLLRMMGMPFDYVALIVVGLLFLALVSLLAVLQIQENRTRRWLEKKWFPDQVAQRFKPKPKPWYQRRPVQWAAGLLVLVAVPLLMLLRSPNPATPLAHSTPAQPSTAVAATGSTATAPMPAPTATVAAPVPAPAVSLIAPAASPAPTDARAALQTAVQAWAQAWSAGDAEAYLAQYSSVFQPAGEQTRAAWERTRRARVTPQQQIRIQLDALELVSVGERQARMRFVQHYAAKQLQDQARKQLDWVLENGQWKIQAETVLAP